MSKFTVRPIEARDAAGVAYVHVHAWREAYTGRMPLEILDARTVERMTASWERQLADPSNPWRNLVAEDETGIFGFASVLDTPTEAPLDGIELGALYVLARAYGNGAGQALFDAGVGTRASGLWVLDDNPRAQAFYRRNGYTMTGEEKTDERYPGGVIRELRMARPGTTA